MSRVPVCRLAAVLVICLALGYAAGAAWLWPTSRAGFWVSTTLEVIGPIVGGALAVLRSQELTGRAHQAWLLLGAGACAWGLGSLAYSWYELALHSQEPFPGLSAYGFLLAIALLAAGISRYPTLSRRRWSFARTGMDTLLVMTSTLLVGWVVAIGPVYESSQGHRLSEAVALAYPCGDVLVITMLLLLLRRTPAGGREPLLLLLTGMLLIIFSDTAFALLSARGEYFTGHWIDPGWWAGLILVGIAACRYTAEDGPLGERPPSSKEILVPYLVAVFAVLVGAFHWFLGNTPSPIELVLVAVLLLLLLARQSVVAMDSVDLARELHFHAYHDPLTELPNRRSLQDHIDTQSRNGSNVEAVLLIDLDGFKEVNDTLGHEAGDRLLRETAQRLAQAVRDKDVIARLGGDEFAVVLMTGSDPDAAAQRLLARMREPFEVAGTTVSLSASIGIAPAVSGVSGDDLLRNADLAMYRAKGAGRDRASLYQPVLHDQARARMELSIALHEAVDRGEFRLLYQPIVEVATGRTVGAEALIRWNRFGRLLPPEDFLPMLEAGGLIVGVGDWILDRACTDLATWRAEGHLGARVAVNAASRQLCDPEFAARVAATLARRGIPADRLTLEITEAVILDDDQTEGTVRAVLGAINELGVRLALDDFGTGYASLSTLRTLPVSTIKVDRSFIGELDTGGSATVDGIAYLAHRYGLTVVAEGVETPRQRERLRHTGIGFAQGYLFAPPLEAADISRRLRAENPVRVLP